MKVLLIDDDLSIRFTLKKLFNKYLPYVEVYTSEDGVEGLGYAYIISPAVVIVDSTLPKYSGHELVDFIVANPRFQNIPIIMLAEDKELTDLPVNFTQVSKRDPEFLSKLASAISLKIGQKTTVKYSRFTNFLARKIIKYSNLSNRRSSKIRESNIFKKLFFFAAYLFDQLLVSVYLTFFYIMVGRREQENNIDQKKKDDENYRRKVYPSVAIGIAIILLICVSIAVLIAAVGPILSSKIVNNQLNQLTGFAIVLIISIIVLFCTLLYLLYKRRNYE